jgi:hypothetical protein
MVVGSRTFFPKHRIGNGTINDIWALSMAGGIAMHNSQNKGTTFMIEQYRMSEGNRLQENLPSLPLTPEQTREISLLIARGDSDSNVLLDLLANRVEPGVSKSARVKAGWLEDVSLGMLWSIF